MGFKAFRGDAFKHSHENQAFNVLYDILQAEWITREENLYLLGNFFAQGKEFDALIIKNNAIIVIDFKNFGGKLSFSENNNWFCDDIVVKGGNSKNPFLQIRNNKFALMNYIKNRCAKIHSEPNLGHIAGLVMFHQPIEIDDDQIPKQIKSWFHICELGKAIRTIDGIASAEIDMYPHELDLIIKAFDIPEYFPDGGPTIKIMTSEFETFNESELSPIGSQKSILAQVEKWLTTEISTFVLKGMSSTGKRTLLREIIKIIQVKNKAVLLIAPNARLAKKYTETQIGEFVSIYQVLYSNKSDGVVKKSNGIELAKHSIILTHEVIKDKILIVVESHLISNSYYDMENVVFGSGHMVNDLLSAFENELPKLMLVGDPYQLSRGDLELNLLSCQTLREKGLYVEEVLLDQQIESEPKELHDFQFEIAQQMQQKYFNKLPIANNDIVSKVENDPNVGKDITSSRFHAVYLTALNDVAQKINFAAKQKILQQSDPYVLNAGDIIDFHSSCPIITGDTNDEIDTNKNWIHSGEIVTVTAVDTKIDTIEMTLKGRNVPTSLQIGYLNCRLPKLGDVKLSYIIDYLHADKPELSTDQILVLNIKAREEAYNAFKHLKAKLDKNSEEYKSEKKKYEELVQKHILNSPLLNAARIRYAYAMTVHRAQGREWNTVYLDASRSSSGDSITNDGYFRFLYTASMSAEKRFKLLKYPELTPLFQTQFIPNKNCKICAITATRGFSYTFPNVVEFESFNYPIRMNSDIPELKAIYFCVTQLLYNSQWRISGLKQYSYQELYTFENTIGKKVQVRFTYDKSIKVKNLTFLDDSVEPTLKEELSALLINNIVFDDSRLNIALTAMRNFLETLGFEIIDARSSGEWELQVLCAKNSEVIQLKTWITKTGLISKIMPEKATSKEVIELFKESINGQ